MRIGNAMTIGIIGSGNVGGTLGTRWARNGHKVVLASRNPDSDEMKELAAKAGTTASTATSKDAVAQCDILLLATPWPATEQILKSLGDLSGKILIDATNPLLPDLSGLAIGTTSSAGELVEQWARGARVVKAFNTVGYNIMADPKFDAGGVAMFYCGDDAEAKAVVKGLIGEIGFVPLDAGPLTQSRLLEPFALLWISLALKGGYGLEIGFEFLKR